MILYFSATGNSEYVAKRIANRIGDECLNLFERLRAEDHSPLESETPWVIVCPTYAWKIPQIVQDWLRETELLGEKRIYFVLTCGTSIAGAGMYAKELAGTKRMEYKGTAAVKMPENYIAMFATPDEETALEIIDRSEDKIDAIADNIKNGAWLEELSGGKLQSMIMNRAFDRFVISDRKFLTTDKCTGCGQCVKVCPTENIYLDDKERHPVWSGRCIHCMACINRCAFGAIEYGGVTEKRERYRCPKTL